MVLDDTCYSLACQTKKEAQLLGRLLNSDTAKEFYSALIFWDAKRPITAAILRRLDLVALAQALKLEKQLEKYLKPSVQISLALPHG